MKRGTVVPAFLDDGNWSACFGLSYMNLTLHDLAHHGRIIREHGTYLRKVAGTGGIPEGRNECARNFLDHTDGEWLWFVDTDMGFAPETVDRLVASADEHRRPVVGGLCFAQRKIADGPYHSARNGVIPTIYSLVETADEVGFLAADSYPRDEVVQVAGTGAACLLIHRRVLRKIRAKYGDAWFDPYTHPTGMRGRPRTFSEDLSFCLRVAGVGEDVHVDTAVKTVHHKGGIFLDEDLYLGQQEAAALLEPSPQRNAALAG